MNLLDEFVRQAMHKYLTREIELGQYVHMEIDGFEGIVHLTGTLHYTTVYVDMFAWDGCFFKRDAYEKTIDLEKLPCAGPYYFKPFAI